MGVAAPELTVRAPDGLTVPFVDGFAFTVSVYVVGLTGIVSKFARIVAFVFRVTVVVALFAFAKVAVPVVTVQFTNL
jgi:hypothetical protein